MSHPGGDEGSGEAQIAIPIDRSSTIRDETVILGTIPIAQVQVVDEGIVGRNVMTTLNGKRSTLGGIETQNMQKPLLSLGKVIDIPTTSSSSRDALRITYVNKTTITKPNLVPPQPPPPSATAAAVVEEEPSGSRGSLLVSDIRPTETNHHYHHNDHHHYTTEEITEVPDVGVPRTLLSTATAVAVVPSSSASTTPSSSATNSPSAASSSSSSSSSSSASGTRVSTDTVISNEIATIDTDTDDDVILVAPPMEVIDVDDIDDEEDVQIVSHTPIPKPFTERKSRLVHNTTSTATTVVAAMVVPPPPILPPPQFEIDDELDTNLPVASLINDFINEAFDPIDFDTLQLEHLSPTSEKRIPAMSAHESWKLSSSITEEVRMLNNKEIAIQTEILFQEAATQTDPEPETKKRKWDYNDDDGDGTACPICMEPWEESGEHRLVSLKCGHLFGDSCLQRWFTQHSSVPTKRICPVCRQKTAAHHVRPLFARRVVQIKYERINELKAELAKYKKRCSQYEQQQLLQQQQQQQQQQNQQYLRPGPTQAAPVQLSVIPPPPPVSHHGPPPASGPHATGPFHPTTTTVMNPNITPFATQIERIPVYGAPSLRMHEYIHHSRYHQIFNGLPHDHEYPI